MYKLESFKLYIRFPDFGRFCVVKWYSKLRKIFQKSGLFNSRVIMRNTHIQNNCLEGSNTFVAF